MFKKRNDSLKTTGTDKGKSIKDINKTTNPSTEAAYETDKSGSDHPIKDVNPAEDPITNGTDDIPKTPSEEVKESSKAETKLGDKKSGTLLGMSTQN